MAICFAKVDSANTSPRRGPVCVNIRVVTTVHAVRLRVVAAQQIRRHFRNRVRRRRVKRARFVDGKPLARHAPEHFGRRADVDDRAEVLPQAEALEQPARAENVRLERLERGVEADARVALRRQVKDVVGPREVDRALHRQAVAQVALDQRDAIAAVDPREQMLDVVHRASPAAEADDVPVGVGEEEVGEVRPHHPGDARDERASRPSLTPDEARRLAMSASAASRGSVRRAARTASSTTARARPIRARAEAPAARRGRGRPGDWTARHRRPGHSRGTRAARSTVPGSSPPAACSRCCR